MNHRVKAFLDSPGIDNQPTWRAWFREVLDRLYLEVEEFGGKQPLGFSGWNRQLEQTLIDHGITFKDVLDAMLPVGNIRPTRIDCRTDKALASFKVTNLDTGLVVPYVFFVDTEEKRIGRYVTNADGVFQIGPDKCVMKAWETSVAGYLLTFLPEEP